VRLAAGGAVVGLALLAGATALQLRYWQSSYALYAHALAVVERNWMAHNNMGVLLSQHGRNDEAMVHFRESVRLNPRGIEGFRNLGNSLLMAGRNAEAIEAFRQAVWINPNDAESHARLGYAYLLAGNSDFALQEYALLQCLNSSYAQSLLDSIRILGRQH
jgi:Flp pilus assembly protein TadD